MDDQVVITTVAQDLGITGRDVVDPAAQVLTGVEVLAVLGFQAGKETDQTVSTEAGVVDHQIVALTTHTIIAASLVTFSSQSTHLCRA